MENLIKENTFNVENAIDAFIKQNNRITDPLITEFEFLKWIDEGRLVVLGGGSGLGKTAYVLQMLYNLVKDNQDREDSTLGIYCSSEMMVEELTMRLLVNQGVIDNVNMANIRKMFNSKLTSPKEIKENTKKAKFILGDLPFYFINSSRFNLKNIVEMLHLTREQNTKKRIFIAIDYLQLMLLDSENLQETNRVIKDLKDVLVDTRSNAIVVSALNRDSIRNDYVDMSAFKDSSMIEYTSDIAMLFAFKKEGKNGNISYTLKQSEKDKTANKIEFQVKCIKNRIGKMFSDRVEFDKLNQKFDINACEITYEEEEYKPTNESENKNDEKKEIYSALELL